MVGRFLSFEGIDGSGKSTQARLLADALRAQGHAVTLTREPGGSPGAEEIRRLVLEGDPDRWSPETEILLFTAARRDHMERTIRPALDRGEIVITDRFADSTRIYQGITRGDLVATVDRLHDLMIATDPDLTILVDSDPALGRAEELNIKAILRKPFRLEEIHALVARWIRPRGLDDEGALLLRDAQGRVARYRAGEVTIEKPA